jgi:hypothetical protein
MSIALSDFTNSIGFRTTNVHTKVSSLHLISFDNIRGPRNIYWEMVEGIQNIENYLANNSSAFTLIDKKFIDIHSQDKSTEEVQVLYLFLGNIRWTKNHEKPNHMRQYVLIFTSQKNFKLLSSQSKEFKAIGKQKLPLINKYLPIDGHSNAEIQTTTVPSHMFSTFYKLSQIDKEKLWNDLTGLKSMIPSFSFNIDPLKLLKQSKKQTALQLEKSELIRLNVDPSAIKRDIKPGVFGVKSAYTGGRLKSITIKPHNRENTIATKTRVITDFEVCNTKGAFKDSFSTSMICKALTAVIEMYNFMRLEEKIEHSTDDAKLLTLAIQKENMLGALSSSFFQDISWRHRMENIATPTIRQHDIDIDQVLYINYSTLFLLRLIFC